MSTERRYFDTRSQKFAARTQGLCPMAVAGKSFNVIALQKYHKLRAEKKQNRLESMRIENERAKAAESD